MLLAKQRVKKIRVWVEVNFSRGKGGLSLPWNSEFKEVIPILSQPLKESNLAFEQNPIKFKHLLSLNGSF